jgi:hypothetical protein
MAVDMEDFQCIFVFKKLMRNQRWHTDVVREAGCVVVVEQGDYAAPCARALCQSPER